MVSSLSSILCDNSTKTFGKNNKGITPPSIQTESIWSNYFKTKKPAIAPKKEEGFFASLYSKIKEQVKENKFTNAVLLFLHIKSDKRYQNLSPQEKQKLNEYLKKYNFDISNVDAAYEKINSYLEELNVNSKNKHKNFLKAMKSAAKFSMKYNYHLLTGSNILAELLEKKLEKSLSDDNNLFMAILDYASEGMKGNEKAKFIGESTKNSVVAREEAFKYLEKLIKKNPTTKERIEKLYELNQKSSLSVTDMVIELLESTVCDEKVKSKIRKTIAKIKNNIPKEYEKHWENLKKSNAWLYITESKKRIIESAKTEVNFAEKRVRNQKICVEKKKKNFEKENKKLCESKHQAKKMKRQADEIVESVRIKNNFAIIPENHKDDVIKNNNKLVYKRYKNAQAELKKTSEAEYEAASKLRLAEAFLKIDKKYQDFAVERYNCLMDLC